MKTIVHLIVKLRIWADDQGQDLIEYALMAGFVAIAAGAIMPGVSSSVNLSSPTHTGAMAIPRDIWYLRSSGSLAPSVVPASTFPARSNPPVATTRASRSDVLPTPFRPISATVRALGWLGAMVNGTSIHERLPIT